MSDQIIHSPHSLRSSFIEHVMKPLRKRYPYEFGNEMNIEIRLKTDLHFFERVIERNIDRGRLGSLFKSLINDRYCELLYLFHTSRKLYKMNEDSVFILVTYKDVNIIFRMIDATDEKYLRWELIPLTVLKDNDGFDYNYRIDL